VLVVVVIVSVVVVGAIVIDMVVEDAHVWQHSSELVLQDNSAQLEYKSPQGQPEMFDFYNLAIKSTEHIRLMSIISFKQVAVFSKTSLHVIAKVMCY
jgi:hypothetical protein